MENGRMAAIALFQLVRQEGDVIQQPGKALVALRQLVEFRYQFRADREVRIGLAQESEDAIQALHVFNHDGGNQAVSLTGRAIAAVPIAPKRQEGGLGGVGQLPGIFLASDQSGQIQQDFVGFLLRVDAYIPAEIFLPQFQGGFLYLRSHDGLMRHQSRDERIQGQLGLQ